MINKLLNPFENFTDKQLVKIGLFGWFLGGLFAFLFNGRFDGLLNFHLYHDVKIWQPFIDILINTSIYSGFLYFFAFYINPKSRKIDLYVVSLWAQLPFFILPFFNLNGHLKAFENELLDSLLKNPHDMSIVTDNIWISILIALLSITSILGIIIFFYWSWLGLKWSTNTKNKWHLFFLIIIIILASILSKSFINSINS
jgi:hypothetical protein